LAPTPANPCHERHRADRAPPELDFRDHCGSAHVHGFGVAAVMVPLARWRFLPCCLSCAIGLGGSTGTSISKRSSTPRARQTRINPGRCIAVAPCSSRCTVRKPKCYLARTGMERGHSCPPTRLMLCGQEYPPSIVTPCPTNPVPSVFAWQRKPKMHPITRRQLLAPTPNPGTNFASPHHRSPTPQTPRRRVRMRRRSENILIDDC